MQAQLQTHLTYRKILMGIKRMKNKFENGKIL